MLRRHIGAAVVTLLVLPACGDSKKSVEITRSEEVPVELSVSMVGDVTMDFKETVKSRFILRRTASKAPGAHESQVVGTEPVDPVKYGKGLFIAGAAVIPFTGDGKYTIPAGSIFDAAYNPQQAVGSTIKVEWWPDGDLKKESEVYMRRARPCDVVVAGDGTRGTVTCPDVTNEKRDKHFRMVLRWVAPKAPAPTTTTAATTP